MMREQLSNERVFPSSVRRQRHSQEPDAAMFEGLRLRLTLWYCGVLVVALVLFGVFLYVGARYFLLSPIERAATNLADHLSRSPEELARECFLPASFLGQPDPSQPGPKFAIKEIVMCFDQNGMLLSNQNTARISGALLNNSLARTIVQTGQSAADTVDGGSDGGLFYRYATVVPATVVLGGRTVSVVMVAESIQVQQNVLSLLLALLLVVGGVALLGAGLGGLFLAHRSLAPARLAWARQQRFIADAAHELRTPLTLLRADAEVLLRGRQRLAADDAALLEDIVAEAEHMGKLANNMLTLARLDSQAAHREHEVVDLAEVARNGARRVQALANEKDISLWVEAGTSVLVIGDWLLLEQATLALLDNAIKYNHQGGQVTIHTTIREGQAFLEVGDTGIGISPEHLPHLGERFYRVDKARSREAGGTGLGLSIVRHIAATHGGSLTLRSIPGQGTVATMALPLARRALSHHEHRAVPGNISSNR